MEIIRYIQDNLSNLLRCIAFYIVLFLYQSLNINLVENGTIWRLFYQSLGYLRIGVCKS